MRRRDVVKAGLATLAVSATGGIGGFGKALAQSKMVLKASDVHPAGYPTVAATENLGKKLEAAWSTN